MVRVRPLAAVTCSITTPWVARRAIRALLLLRILTCPLIRRVHSRRKLYRRVIPRRSVIVLFTKCRIRMQLTLWARSVGRLVHRHVRRNPLVSSTRRRHGSIRRRLLTVALFPSSIVSSTSSLLYSSIRTTRRFTTLVRDLLARRTTS